MWTNKYPWFVVHCHDLSQSLAFMSWTTKIICRFRLWGPSVHISYTFTEFNESSTCPVDSDSEVHQSTYLTHLLSLMNLVLALVKTLIKNMWNGPRFLCVICTRWWINSVFLSHSYTVPWDKLHAGLNPLKPRDTTWGEGGVMLMITLFLILKRYQVNLDIKYRVIITTWYSHASQTLCIDRSICSHR